MKKQLAGILALAMSLSMASCSSDTGSGEAADETTTTAAAVKDETTAKADDGDTEASQDEEQETTAESVEATDDSYFEKALAMLPDAELKRAYQEVKVYSNYNPPELAVQLFEQKYGGTVSVYYNDTDLSNYIYSGEGIDLYMTDGYYDLPKLITINTNTGFIVPFDDYIDLDSDIWQDTRDYMELYNFGGKHFNIVTNVSASYACYYNKKTIEEYGFDDPWELYKAGNWNWDTMKSMLSKFADEEDLRYGLDGSYQDALYMSAGVPMVSLSDGKLVGNGADKTFLTALDFGQELFNNRLLLPLEDYGYNYQPQMLDDGDLLFYIGGAWELNTAPEKWSMEVSPEDIGVVPVPSPAGSDPYQKVSVTGCAFVKNSENPEGAALFAMCLALAYNDSGIIAANEQKQKDEYGLSDQIIAQLNEINELAKQYPVVEHAYGDFDIYYYLRNDYNPVNAAFSGQTLDSGFANSLSVTLEQVNNNIQKAIENLG